MTLGGIVIFMVGVMVGGVVGVIFLALTGIARDQDENTEDRKDD